MSFPICWRLAPLLAYGFAVATGAAADSWRSLGPEGGTITILRFARTDPRIVYAATQAGLNDIFLFGERPPPGGRVFRSADGGTTWSPRSTGLPVSRILALAVDPQRADVAYVGNAEGLWKTIDGGQLWFPVYGPLAGQAVTALAIAPGQPSTIYAGTAGSGYLPDVTPVPGRVYRTDDGGRHWALRSPDITGNGDALDSIVALAVDSLSAESVIAINAADGATCAPYWKTSNGGRDWHTVAVTGYFSDIASCPDASGIQEDPTSHKLYVSSPLQALVSSSDFGETWASEYSSLPDAVVSANGKLYAGTGSEPRSKPIYVSSDGGVTWTQVGLPPDNTQLLAADPSVPDALLAGAVHGGLLRSTDGGGSWSRANEGLVASVITGLAADIQHPGTLYIGTPEAGALASHDDGSDWRSIGPPPYNSAPGDVLPAQEVHAFALTGSELWVEVNGGPQRSSDGGKTWTLLSPVECSDLTGLAPDPDGHHAFAIPSYLTFDGCDVICPFFESSDAGLDWNCPQQSFTSASGVFVDPLNSAVVYGLFVQTARVLVPTPFRVWKSVDFGQTFVESSTGLPPNEGITTLAVSPVAPALLWAGTGTGRVFKSVDQAAHWTPVDRDLPHGIVLALVADPLDPAAAYVEIQGAGVFRTVSAGARWRPLPGLPTNLLDGKLAIGLSGGQRQLYAGTAGAGLFALTIR